MVIRCGYQSSYPTRLLIVAAAARRHEFSNDVEAYLLENSPYERWRWFHRNSPKIVLPLCGFVAQRAQIV